MKNNFLKKHLPGQGLASPCEGARGSNASLVNNLSKSIQEPSCI
jgi:hypothetical protein